MGNTISDVRDEVYVVEKLRILHNLGINRGPLPDSTKKQIKNAINSSTRKKELLRGLLNIHNRNNAEQYAYDLLRLKM